MLYAPMFLARAARIAEYQTRGYGAVLYDRTAPEDEPEISAYRGELADVVDRLDRSERLRQ